MTKTSVGLIMGGVSGEHEVSLLSAMSIAAALNPEQYTVVPIGVTKSGAWRLLDPENPVNNSGNITAIELNLKKSREVTLTPSTDASVLSDIDVFFPITHGTYGEDGKLQGVLSLTNKPYVGPDTLGSALGMDKDVCKRLLDQTGIPVVPWVTMYAHQTPDLAAIIDHLGTPLFVKPCRQGSSIGVEKARDKCELARALDRAFRYDTKIIIEQGVTGREVEVSVIGNADQRQASSIGEIKPCGEHEFYDYDAKYVDDAGAELIIPAQLDQAIVNDIQKMAIKICAALEIEGMARVDLFITADHQIFVNEVNTLPGFTSISMYPKLWEHAGLAYHLLLEKLIGLGIKRWERDQKIDHPTATTEL